MPTSRGTPGRAGRTRPGAPCSERARSRRSSRAAHPGSRSRAGRRSRGCPAVVLADDDQRRHGELAEPLRAGRARALDSLAVLRPAAAARTRGAASRPPGARRPGSTSSGERRGPSTHMRRLTSTAASRSPRSRAASSSAQPAWVSAENSWPRRPDPTSTSAETSSGPCDGDLERDARRPARRRRERPAPSARLSIRPTRSRACENEPRRDRRLAEAAHVVADRPMHRRKGRPLGLPHPAVGDALVDEDDRRAFARDLVVQLDLRRLAHAGASCPRLDSMPSSSSVNESMNFWTPSRSSVSETSS